MISKLLEAYGSYLKAQYEASATVGHNLEKGEWRESFIRNWLSEILPEKYGVTSGIVFSAEYENGNTQSKQQDVIIYDRINCPRLFVNATQAGLPKCIPIESVYCTIEVKSSIDSEKLVDAIKNYESVRRLKKHPFNFDNFVKGGINPPAGFIFAFDSQISLDKIADILRSERNKNSACHIQGVIVLGVDSDEGGIVSYRSNNNVNEIVIEPTDPHVVEVYSSRPIGDVMLLFMSLLINTLNYTIIQRPDMAYYINTGKLSTSESGWTIPFRSINEHTRIVDENGNIHNIFGSKELDMDHRIVNRTKQLIAEGESIFSSDEYANLAFAHLFLAVKEKNVVPEFADVFKGFTGNILDVVEKIAYEKDYSLTAEELRKFRCQFISTLNRIRVKYNPQMNELQKRFLICMSDDLDNGRNVEKILEIHKNFDAITAGLDMSKFVDEEEMSNLILTMNKREKY